MKTNDAPNFFVIDVWTATHRPPGDHRVNTFGVMGTDPTDAVRVALQWAANLPGTVMPTRHAIVDWQTI